MYIRRVGSGREMNSSSDVADLGGFDQNTLHVMLPEDPESGWDSVEQDAFKAR